MNKIERLTESEELVMKAIWDLTKESVLSEITEKVNGTRNEPWRPQTVSTFLAKLVRKGFVKLCRDGKIYTYKILIKESDYRRKLYLDHINFWYHGDVKELVVDMVLNGDLREEELKKLEDEL